MLANIIATIMMALGVATGNVSSNVYKGGNAFYDAKQQETKPIQKANNEEQPTTILYEDEWYKSQEIQRPGNTWNGSKKYYLKDDNVQHGSNYYNGHLNITNTVYTFEDGKYSSNNQSVAKYIGIFQIDNYQDIAVLNTSIKFKIYLDTSNIFNVQNTYHDRIVKVAYDQIYTNYIDNTLTTWDSADNLYNQIKNVGDDWFKVENVKIDQSAWTTVSTDQYTYPSESVIEIPYIEAHSNIQIVVLGRFVNWVNSGNDAYYKVDMTDGSSIINITGYIQPVSTNYEVVDIPNVMYTILTMPFSFISTAFNLTVFPGTPYSLNFGNLFLTIIAIFILLWIIKKVFH